MPSPILLPNDFDSIFQMLLRWTHLLAGITWIGLLYFFNLVLTPALPALDPPVRGKLITLLLPKALWWFRWGAIVTVAAGGTYWVILLSRDGAPMLRTLLIWAVLIYAAFKLQVLLLRLPALANNPALFVIVVLLLVGLQGHAMTTWLVYPGMSHRALSIAIGGGIGVFLLHNVLEVVWPAQQRFIRWCAENPGQPPPPTSPPPSAAPSSSPARASGSASPCSSSWPPPPTSPSSPCHEIAPSLLCILCASAASFLCAPLCCGL